MPGTCDPEWGAQDTYDLLMLLGLATLIFGWWSRGLTRRCPGHLRPAEWVPRNPTYPRAWKSKCDLGLSPHTSSMAPRRLTARWGARGPDVSDPLTIACLRGRGGAQRGQPSKQRLEWPSRERKRGRPSWSALRQRTAPRWEPSWAGVLYWASDLGEVCAGPKILRPAI